MPGVAGKVRTEVAISGGVEVAVSKERYVKESVS